MAQEIADSKLLDTWGSSGRKIEPDITKIIEGWQLGEQPPHEYMNWLQNTFGSKLNHILKNGVAEWNNKTEYLSGSSVKHNGNVWICETTNTNSEPTNLNANWEKVAINKDLTVTVDTLADLRSISYPANTVWASGYHAKNDGAFGSHIFRLKGVKTTETDNGGTVIVATIGGTDYVYELQYNGTVNIKWFGAKGDDINDDTEAIQRTIDSVPKSSFILIPQGQFQITSTIQIRNDISLVGEGGLSRIKPNSCTAFRINRSDSAASRKISNFWIWGQNTSDADYYGIIMELDGADRVTNLTIEDLYISWIATAMLFNGLWHSNINRVQIGNSNAGIIFKGRNVKCTVSNSSLVRNSIVTGGGINPSYGISIVYDAINERSEDIRIDKNIIFGYNTGVNCDSVLSLVISQCDLDYCRENGIAIKVANGGCSIIDNWIAMDTSLTTTQYNVYLIALLAETSDGVMVANNKLNSAYTAGVYIRANQTNHTIRDNFITSRGAGIYLDNGSKNIKVIGNKIESTGNSITLVGTIHHFIGQNNVNNIIYSHPTIKSSGNYDYNYGQYLTKVSGLLGFPASVTTATFTWAELGLTNVFQEGQAAWSIGYAINLGGLNRGNIKFLPSKTGITVTVGVAAGTVEQFSYYIETFNRI